jgi:type IV secretory pathway VirB4 component
MAKRSAARAQSFVPVREIRNNVVIAKDGSLHAVLMASSLNFALKSSDEQDAIIAQYQNFLNALDFSVQILVHSRKLNISPYLETLREQGRAQINELLKIQTTEYVEFIKNFVEVANIVSKTFYVVVSFTPPVLQSRKGFFGGMLGALSRKKQEAGDTAKRFDEHAAQLQQRLDVVSQGLASAGVRTAVLQTEELVELFFGLFNPGELERGKVSKLPQQ